MDGSATQRCPELSDRPGCPISSKRSRIQARRTAHGEWTAGKWPGFGRAKFRRGHASSVGAERPISSVRIKKDRPGFRRHDSDQRCETVTTCRRHNTVDICERQPLVFDVERVFQVLLINGEQHPALEQSRLASFAVLRFPMAPKRVSRSIPAIGGIVGSPHLIASSRIAADEKPRRQGSEGSAKLKTLRTVSVSIHPHALNARAPVNAIFPR